MTQITALRRATTHRVAVALCAAAALVAGCPGPAGSKGGRGAVGDTDSTGGEGREDAKSGDPKAGPAATSAPDPLASGVPAGLARSEPLTCVGTDGVEASGVYIDTTGDGVTVRGSCTITIRKSTIKAGRYALLIQGGGDIVIEDSVVVGGSAAVAIPGLGMIRAKNTRFKGYKSLTGGGDVEDRGGNTWE